MDGEIQSEEELELERPDRRTPSPSAPSTLYAVIRIKQKYQALKKRRQELSLALGGAGSLVGAPVQSSPKIFTFEGNGNSPGPGPHAAHGKRRKSRKRRVLYPSRQGRRAPPRQEYSLAKYSLYLLFAIVFMQVRCTCPQWRVQWVVFPYQTLTGGFTALWWWTVVKTIVILRQIFLPEAAKNLGGLWVLESCPGD